MFEGLSNFLQGYGWVNNAQLDNEKKKKRDAYNASVSNASKQQAALPADRSNLTPSQRGAAAIADANTASLPIITPNVQSAWDTNPVLNTLKKTGGFVADLGSRIAETGDRAKTGIDLAVNNLDFTKSEADKKANERFQLERLNSYQGFRDNLDEQGYNNSKEIDQVARRISTGQGDLSDVGKAAAYSLNAGLTLAAPVSVAVTAGRTIAAPTFATVGKGVLGETALYGTGATAAQALDGQQLTPEQIALNYGLAGGGAALFGFGGLGIGRLKNDRAATIAKTVDDLDTIGAQKTSVLAFKQKLVDTADDIERSAIDTPTSELGKLDDGISSEITAQSKRQAAQDTANRLRQEASQIPDEVQPPRQITTQNLSTPETSLVLQKATPDQLLARAEAGDLEAAAAIQKQFDDASQAIEADTVAPTPDAPVSEVIEPAQPIDNILESPITAQSREIAEATPPVVTRQADELTSYEGAPDRAAVDEYKRRIANGDELEPVIVMRDSQGNLGIEDGKHRFQAYQEMGVKDIPTIERTPNPLSSIEAEGRQLIDSANATLATEGKTVGDLVQKLARANETGVPAQLTRAEQTAFQQLNDAVNSAQETAMRSGLITPETGNISQYLPTGAADNVLPTQLSDIANQDFNYSMRRTNALSDKQLKEGGENAFLDYYLRGRGSENLDDATIDAQNATRAEVIAREEMFSIPREGGSPDQLDVTPEVKAQMESAAIDAADARRAQINAERAQSVGDRKLYKEQAEIAREKGLDSAAKNLKALEDSVSERAALISASNLSAAEKAKRYSALYDHLDSVISKKTYIQPFVTSNVLGQVPGRVADQVSKAIASTTDNLTSILSQAGARGSFKRGTGRSLQTDSKTLRKVVKNTDAYKMFDQNKLEAQLNKKAGLGNPWTRGVTRVTQAGSRVRKPIKDTVSYFASKAQAEGLKSADDISRYVLEASRSPEWDKVYGLFYSSRNRFSGVPSFLPDANGNLVMIQTPLDPLFNSIERGLQKAVDMIPGVASKPGLRKNLRVAIRQSTLGFPRVIANQGYQAINTASLGTIDLIRAATIKGTDDLSRLKKAVLIKQGLEGLQTGAGAYALGGSMGAAGLVTGAYPEDPAEQKRWQDEGIQEYSVNIGGKWVDPFRYAGLAGLPLMIGGLVGSGKATDLGGLAVDVAGALGQNFGVGALQDLTKFLSGDTPQGQTTSLAMNFIGQFVPGLSQLNSLANATDPNQRDLKSQDWGQEFINRGINKIPFARQTLEKKTDQFGNEIKNPGFGVAAVLPIQGGNTGVGDDPAQAEVSRLQQLGLDAYPKGVDGSSNNYTLKDGEDTAIPLTDAQQKDLNNVIKTGKQDMVNTLVASEAYQNATDEEKAKMLKSIYSTNSAGIASQWAEANGIENAKQDTLGISASLDADKASALAVAEAMDTDTRDKWLEDKTNAVNYHVGKYENAIANGTLTAKDDNLESSSSLHYKAIASQVNATLPYWTATLEEQYKNTSKKELAAMSPDNPVRQALLALDQARASAGVSLKDGDHSAAKYGAVSGSGGGSGDNFSFASSKAVNAEKSGFTDPTVKSAWNAPLVKPNAIGEASNKVKRKISVKRGVSL